MKKIILATVAIAVSLSLFTPPVMAATRVRGSYNHKTFRYTQPHYRTNKNSSRLDNWSTKGNTNPFTAKKGYTSPYNKHKLY